MVPEERQGRLQDETGTEGKGGRRRRRGETAF
jgi:hypothetical protein